MKIGIITFHWQTNYGAILQAYAMQEYLIASGHSVDIINYKPKNYFFDFKYALKHPGIIRNIFVLAKNYNKEHKLSLFRRKFLNLTKRYYSTEELKELDGCYDMIISGSDQILNPSFTEFGERKPTSAYYLSFAPHTRNRIGYAVSFGCVNYPTKVSGYASVFLQNFTKIGIRENTGRKILEDLGYTREITLVPDPTIIYGSQLFQRFNITPLQKKSYICVYALRRKIRVKHRSVIYIDDNHNSYDMEGWISAIVNSRLLITNSYHGMIVALLNHIPFIVNVEIGKGSGMNDRFNTLLRRLDLLHLIVEDTTDIEMEIDNIIIDWADVDRKIEDFRMIGIEFLKTDN